MKQSISGSLSCEGVKPSNRSVYRQVSSPIDSSPGFFLKNPRLLSENLACLKCSEFVDLTRAFSSDNFRQKDSPLFRFKNYQVAFSSLNSGFNYANITIQATSTHSYSVVICIKFAWRVTFRFVTLTIYKDGQVTSNLYTS